jgi:hypothetical protein
MYNEIGFSPALPLTTNEFDFGERLVPLYKKQAKAVLTDSHFLVPFVVLMAGIVLLVALR